MPLTCPFCRHALPASDDPQRYCAFCGQRLAESTPRAGRPAPPEPPKAGPTEPESAPAEVGGYRILRPLGTGGMGDVYEAEPVGGGPRVAIKILSGRLQANPVSVERFRQEGRLAAQIAHPRCVFVLRADADRGRPYIVMELMPGDTLKDLVDRRKAIPAAESIRYILDVIDGLQEAHRLGVIHRDVKPSNCFLLPDGRVKVGDFGLSKSLGSAAQLTTSGAFLGTVLYASPEQIKGEPVDFASDVYSVCATLYHLLAGRAPFHHENPTAVLAKIISEDPPDVRSVNPVVPADLARVVHRGLARDRDRRYATLAELRADLAALVPEQLTFGGMGVRVASYLLDDLVIRLAVAAPIALVGQPDWFARIITLLAFPTYFSVMEGLWGRSVGKWALGLRVCRQGTTLAPGLRRAALRGAVFGLLVTVPEVLARVSLTEDPTGGLLSFLPLLVGLVLVGLPMRRSNDFRGLHETVSGTWVLRLPVVPRPLKLVGRHGDRLAAVPPRPAEFPEAVGPYTVAHAVRAGDQWVAIGDDQVLGRRVVLRLYPDRDGPRVRAAGGRPGRLWPLGHGTARVAGAVYRWEAYVAPSGAPLADVVDREHPVRWPEARMILEQFAAELAAAQKDGSLPGQLSLDQVWVQPDGRPQLLDFPPGPATGLTNAVGLLGQSATALLEGVPRTPNDLGPVRGPLPRHADRLVTRLLGGSPAIGSPEEFADELAATRGLPARVTRPLRGVQLAIQAGFLAPGLAFMFGAAGLYSVFGSLETDPVSALRRDWWTAGLAILAWPVLWAGAALMLRGGISFLLTGIRVVRTAGGPATRRRCALRSLLVWIPVALVLCASVIMRTADVGAVLWWAALGLLPLYVAAALLDPERGPHDRLLGTWLVPR